MFRGIVYLTGLLTLTIIGLAAAVAFRVHTWPWREYVETGRREVARRLDPAGDGNHSNKDVQDGQDGQDRNAADHPVNPAHPCSRPSRRGEPQSRNGWMSRPSGPGAGARTPAPRPRVPDRGCAPVVRRHVVASGETLYGIAERYSGAGERWPQIARANDIREPSDLRVGQTLVIPLNTVAFDERPGEAWAPDLRLEFAPACGGAPGPHGESEQ